MLLTVHSFFAIYNAIDATVKQVVSGERGTVVYTTSDGTRLLRENNTLYSQELATGYQRAIDGLWYKKEDFNNDGTLLNPSNIFGKTLSDLNTNRGYFLANDGKWYTQDQLQTEKYVPKSGATGGLTSEQFAATKAGFANYTFDSTQVILSLVNAEKQENPATEKDATKERTILANLKEALPILGDTDLTAKAKALYLADNTANTEASWTALGTDGQKTWIAKAASEQAKIAVTALLAKNDVTDAHELSKAATLQDLKTLSLAGLDFAGDSGKNVHRNLSEILTIKGGLTDASKLSDNNIGVVANGTDALVVKLAKDIVGLSSTNYGTVTAGTTTSPFTGFTDYMASAINPKANVSGTDLFLGSNRAHYTASLDNTGLHLGSGTTEKATVALINPQNSLNPDSSADGLSVIFTSANNGGTPVSPTDERDTTKAEEVRTAYDGKIFGNAPLGLLVGTMAEGSSNTMQGSTGTGFGVFVGFNNGVVPVTSASGTAFAQPTIFNGVTATRSETGNVQNAGGSSAVVFGAFNSISGNGGLAVGTLNRVYGNEGIVVGNTTLANSYSSVGRFGVTMGFNVKAGEWSQQSVVIGSNMQAVGQGNIILGGGADKFYGAGSGWNDKPDANGVYTQLTNTFDASEVNLDKSGMRFWGDRNIVIGAKNRTEGFNTDFTSSGYTGSTGNGGYQRIADNSVVGTNNTLYDLSKTNSVYGSNNVIASGTNNMVIGSNNRVQAQLGSTTITGAITGRSAAETAAIAALGNVALDATTGKPVGLTYGDNNTIIGSRNTVAYNTGHNFLAGADNIVEANSMYNFLAGSKNISGVDLTNSVAVRGAVTNLFGTHPNISTNSMADAAAIANDLGLVQKFNLSTLLAQSNAQTGMNLLAGSFNIAGVGTSNNVVEGSNVILRNNVKSTYVLGSHIDADQSNSVYIGDYSVATTTPLSTTKGKYEGNLSDLPKNGTDAVITDGVTTTPAVIGLNDLMTAGSTGQTSISINGKTYNFAGVGKTTGENQRSITNEVGTITVGRIVQETDANGKTYNKSYGRVIQNVAPGLVGANSTDAINGSQLYAIWDAMESSVARVVTGLDGNVVYTSGKGHRLYSWNNTLYDSALVDGKFKQAANGQWYPVAAFDTQNGNQLKTAFSSSSGFTLGEINQAKIDGKTLTVTGKDGATATSDAWLQEGSNTEDTTSQVVGADNAVLSLVNGSQSTTSNIGLYNVANALSLPNAGTTTQSQQQVAVSKLLLGQNASGENLSAYDFSQATNLKDLQNLALAGMDFTGDTLPTDAASGDKKTVHRNLSEALTITGGVTNAGDLSTTNNIGVIASNNGGSLTLRLAKALTGLTSTEYKTTTTDGTTTTTITSSGVTIQGPTPANGTAPAPISITTSGIDAGNTNITNVKSGLAANSTTIDNTNSAYGATLGDVQKLVNAAAWDIGQTTTTTTTGEGGSSTTSTYSSTGTVNNAERVSFDAGTGTKVTLTKTAAVTSGDNQKPETYSVVFAVKTQELERDPTTGAVTIKSGGDAGGYATAENIQNILDGINTSLTSATFGLADSANGTVTKNLSKTIQVTGYDSNITTEVAKSSTDATANDVLKIKLSPTVTLGDTTTTGTSGSLVVKNAGAADQASAIKLSNGQITFRSNAMSSGTYTDYVLSLVSGTNIPGTTGTNSARLSFNGNQLATLKDGINFKGDILVLPTGATTGSNPFMTALGNGISIIGGVPTTTQESALTSGNIAVVSNGSNTLSLRLTKDLTGMNSIAFGANAAANPYLKISLAQGKNKDGTANHDSSVLRFTGINNTSGVSRIDGIFSDTVTTSGGVAFATKGKNEVVTVQELIDATRQSINNTTASVNNLYYGITAEHKTTTGETTSSVDRSRYVKVLATAQDTVPNQSNFMKILGDDSITVDFVNPSKASETDQLYSSGDLQISLNKDLTLGSHNTTGANTGGSVTINGSKEGASINLDGSSHTLTITSPAENIDGTDYAASTFTLDGRKGKLVFGGDETNATFIDFANTTPVNDLTNHTLQRIVAGTKQHNAPVATMYDGLHFTGNTNDTVDRLLNSTLHLVGNATVPGTGTGNAVQQSDIDKATTDKNTYVSVESYDTGNKDGADQPIMDKRLVIRLAKELTDLNTMTLGGQSLGDDKIASKVKLSTAEAVTVGADSNAKTYSVLKLGNSTGDPALLRNLAEGIDDTDAVTVSQLKNAAWTIGSVSGTSSSTTVNNGDVVNFANGTGTTANVAVSTVDGKDTYTVKFNIDKGSITSDGTTGVASTSDGDNKFVDSKTVVDAITKAVAGATQKYTADNKAGDPPDNVTITRKTGETIGLIGGATGILSDNNIGTVANATDGTIAIKLAKNLTGLESSTYTTTSNSATYTTVINSRGIAITPPVAAGVDVTTKTVSLTDKGLFNGNNNITGLTSPLTGLSTVEDQTHVHAPYGGLSPAFLSTLRDLGVAGTKNTETIKAEQAKLASAATVGDLQNLSNMPIYFSADNYQDELDEDAVVPVKLGEQLSIETGKFVMKLKSAADNTYDISNYDASSADAYNDENMAAVVKDGGILLGFRNTPIFTGLRIGTITTNQDGTTTENSVAIANTTDYSQTDVKPTLKIGGDKAVRITNIATPTEDSDAVNKAYVDLAKATVTGSGAATVTSTKNADHSTNYHVYVDKWLSYVDGSGNNLTNVIKGADNKYYQASALTGLVYHTDTQQWTKENGDPISAQPTAITSAGANLTTFGTIIPVLNNVGKGQIDDASVQAINGSQLKQLVTKLGLSVSNDKTEITGTFNSVNAGGGSTTAPDSVVSAINQLTTAVNKGRVYAGDDYVAAIGNGETEQNAIKRELGERINIKGGADSTTLANLSDGNIGVIVNSSADTLTVKLAKQLKGLTDITFGTDATGDSAADKTVVNKDGITITQGTTVTKFTDNGISAGGQAITNVQDAIANVSEQDIQNKALALYNAENPDAQKTTFADIPSAVKDSYKTRATEAFNKTDVGNMLTASGDILKQATTLYDLQRVANAGLDFVGNNTGTVVHRPLSSTLNIIGEGDYSAITASNPFQSAAGNIYIEGSSNQLIIKLAKNLQNLNSANFSTTEDGKTYTTIVNGKGNTITTKDGDNQTVATSTSTGTTYETLQTVNNGSSTSVVPSAPKVEVSNKGITITKLKEDADGNTIYDTNKTVSLTEDGLNNGGNRISNVADGSADNDVVTVAQLKAGTAAATTKVTGSGAATVTSTTAASDKSTTYNVHVEKVLSYTDAAGNKLVQAANGKYYKEADISGKVYDSSTNTWKNANGSALASQPAEVQVATTAKLANGADGKAPVLSNVSAGAITSDSTDAINGGQLYSLEKDVLGFKEGTGNDANKLVKPTFTAVTAGGTGTTANTTAPTTIVGAIEQLTTAANKGRVYAGDLLVKDTSDTADRQNTFTRQLGETLNIKGGVTDPAKLSDSNIGVVSNGVDTLTVKLAKELKDLTSAQFVKVDNAGNTYTTTTSGDGTTIEQISQDGNKTTAVSNSQGTTYETLTKVTQGGTTVYQPNGPKTTVTNGGITITPKKADGSYDSDKAVSLTENGLNNGGNVITGIKSAVESTKVHAPAGTPANNMDSDGNLINPTFAQRLEAAAAGDTADSAVNVKDLYQVSQNATTAAAAAKTVVKGAGAAVVSKATGAQGQDIYEVKVEQPVTYVDAQNNKLVKGADNKWHKEDDLKGMAYVPGATPGSGVWMKVDENGALVAVPADQAPQEVTPAAMKLVNADGKTTTATTLGNVASAIGGNSSDGSFITNLNKVGTTGEGAIDGNTAVTTQDLKNLADSGFKLQTNSGTAQTIKLGDTVQVVNGANTKVSAITSANGVHTYSINVDGLPMAFKDANGNALVKVGNNFYKASDIGTDGKLKDNAQVATPTEVTLLDKDGAPTAQKLGGIQSSVNDVTALNDPSNANSGAKDNATFADKLATAAANDKLKNSAVNVSDLNEVSKAAANAQATADKGFNVKTSADGGVVNNSGIAASGDNIKPGNTLEFVAGENVTLDQSEGKIKISTNDQNIVNNTQLPIAYVTDVTTKGADGKDVITPTKVYKGADGHFYTDKDLAQRISADGKLNGQALTAEQSAARFDANKVYTAIQNANGMVDKTSVLSNVGDGRIAHGSKEAINGGQLFDLQEYLGVTVINNDTHVDNSTTTVNQLNPVEIKEYSYVTNTTQEKATTIRVPLDENNKPYLKTYNVNNNGEYITNNIYSAVRNINEQGTKYFHVNAGQEIPEAQISNSDDSSASASHSTAIGYQSSVGSGADNSLAVGTRNEVGKDASDAVAVGSAATVIQGSDSAIAIGNGGTVAGSNTISIGTEHIVTGDNSGAIGDPTTINAKSSYSVGNNNSIGDEAVIDEIEKAIKERKELKRPDPLPALEANPTDEQLKAYQVKLAKYQTDLADYLKKKEELATKIKDLSAQVTTENVMAMGNEIKVGAKANNAVAVGTKVTIDAEASDAVAMGTSAHVKASNGVAIGNNALAEAKNGVAIGYNAKSVTENSIALGANAEAKQTLEQLQNAVPWGNLANVRGYGKEVIGEVSVGRTTEDGKQEVRRITNVAAGSAPTDAVNVSQLYGLGADMSKQLGRLNQRVGKLARDLEGVGATSAAMASLPQAYIPGKSLVAVSVGSHKSAQAVAVGVSRISDNGKIILKLNAGHNTVGDTSVGAGVGFQF